MVNKEKRKLKQDINNMRRFKANTEKSVMELFNELNLNGKQYIIIVNGKRSNNEEIVKKGDEIIILPKISGG